MAKISLSHCWGKNHWHAPQKPSGPGSKVSNPPLREDCIIYKAFSGMAVFIGKNDSLFFDLVSFWRARRGLKAMWNILVIIRGLPTFLKKEKIITVLQKQIFPSFISPSKTAQFQPVWRFFCMCARFRWCQEYFIWKVAVTSADDGWCGKGPERNRRTRTKSTVHKSTNLIWKGQRWKNE